jgi:hypothetical protein
MAQQEAVVMEEEGTGRLTEDQSRYAAIETIVLPAGTAETEEEAVAAGV